MLINLLKSPTPQRRGKWKSDPESVCWIGSPSKVFPIGRTNHNIKFQWHRLITFTVILHIQTEWDKPSWSHNPALVEVTNKQTNKEAHATKGVFIATQLNWTQLNSTDPVEQRTAKSVVFLFMTSRPTNWVNCCSCCERVDNSTSSWVELSCVAINTPLHYRPLTDVFF